MGVRQLPGAAASLAIDPLDSLFFTIGEKITKAEIIGTLMALGGAVWLTASDFWVSSQTLLGDITCFVSMLLFSFFLFAGALAYFLYGEVPRPVFYAAGALVVGGAIVVIHAMAATAEGERAAETASTPEV